MIFTLDEHNIDYKKTNFPVDVIKKLHAPVEISEMLLYFFKYLFTKYIYLLNG